MSYVVQNTRVFLLLLLVEGEGEVENVIVEWGGYKNQLFTRGYRRQALTNAILMSIFFFNYYNMLPFATMPTDCDEGVLEQTK